MTENNVCTTAERNIFHPADDIFQRYPLSQDGKDRSAVFFACIVWRVFVSPGTTDTGHIFGKYVCRIYDIRNRKDGVCHPGIGSGDLVIGFAH